MRPITHLHPVQRFRFSEGIPPTCQTIEHRTERHHLRDPGTDDNIKVNLTVFHRLFNDASLYPDYIASDGRITEKDKQERIWKEAEVTEPGYFLWGKLQKKKTLRISSVPGEIRLEASANNRSKELALV